MAKKIKFESFVYLLLVEAARAGREVAGPARTHWDRFVDELRFEYRHGKAWVFAGEDGLEFALDAAELYVRGDDPRHVDAQRARNLIESSDHVETENAAFFQRVLEQVCGRAGVPMPRDASGSARDAARHAVEEAFHDNWAASADVDGIDVRKISEACTSPELRHIRRVVGDLRGKSLLDVGCGLGEASVYFAMEGASVTAMDLSQGMLDATVRLARRNDVCVQTHKAAAEETRLPADRRFDVIYAGNLLHHVDIEATLRLLKPHLAPDGVFVSWDPLAYNPAINIYRKLASGVRTPDEHPLKFKDLRCFRREFGLVETRYFWLTALAIFMWMAIVQRRNPNKERYWKAVVSEADRWRALYEPLSRLDEFLLKYLPPLRLLCWNVVIAARAPRIPS